MKQQRAVMMEFLGTAILAVGIVGSGHMLTSLGADNGLELFVNALATAIALAIEANTKPRKIKVKEIGKPMKIEKKQIE